MYSANIDPMSPLPFFVTDVDVVTAVPSAFAVDSVPDVEKSAEL